MANRSALSLQRSRHIRAYWLGRDLFLPARNHPRTLCGRDLRGRWLGQGIPATLTSGRHYVGLLESVGFGGRSHSLWFPYVKEPVVEACRAAFLFPGWVLGSYVP